MGGPIAAQTFDPLEQVCRGRGGWVGGWHGGMPVRLLTPPAATYATQPPNHHPPAMQPLECFLSASTGSLLVVAVAALRIFLAWKYVGDRLLTASLEYEETGW